MGMAEWSIRTLLGGFHASPPYPRPGDRRPLMAALLTLGTAPTASAQVRICATVDVLDAHVSVDTGRGAQDDCVRVGIL
jgi:hypothetical protein